jgi:sortase A
VTASTTAPPRNPPRHGRVAAVAGVLGELLVTLGVLMGLFVVWQLWWTDVVAGRAQAQIVADLGWQPALPVTGADPTADPTTDPTVAPTDTPPTPDPVEYRTPAPVMKQPAHAVTFAVMFVPRWGDKAMPVSEGVTKHDVLDAKGIGHYDGTAMPGAIGNFSVAGHRTTYGKPFNRIAELQVGDPVIVRTQDTWYVYRVTSSQVVRPWQTDVIDPVPGKPGGTPTTAMMTMTTCHPMYSASERYIVHSELDYWVPVSEGTPVELAGSAAATTSVTQTGGR